MESSLLASEMRELDVMFEIEPFGDARLDKLASMQLWAAVGNKETSSPSDFMPQWPWPADFTQPDAPAFTHPDLLAENEVFHP